MSPGALINYTTDPGANISTFLFPSYGYARSKARLIAHAQSFGVNIPVGHRGGCRVKSLQDSTLDELEKVARLFIILFKVAFTFCSYI